MSVNPNLSGKTLLSAKEKIDLPDDWDFRRLKEVASVRPSNIDKKSSEDEGDVDLCNYTDVYNNQFITSDIEFMEATATTAQINRLTLNKGDILLTKDSESWDDIGVPALVEENLSDVVCAYHLFLVRPDRDKVLPEYLYWAIYSRFVSFQFERSATGVTRYGLSTPKATNVVIPIPPLDIQKKISSYINQQIEKIDSLLEDKENLRNVLEEKVTSSTYEFLKRGTKEGALLKDSRIPSFGKIPAHWEVVPNKAIFREVNNKSETGDGELLSVSETTGVTLRSEKDVNMFESKSLEGYKKAKKDDLVINTMWAWKGAAGISPQNGLVSPSYHVYRPNDRMLPEFADILYRSPAYVSEMDRFSEGVWKSRNRLYPDVFLRMDTVLPPKEEQQRIVDELVKKHNTIDRLDGLIDDSIELLEEKKQSIITKVVTGQIQVISPKKGSLEVEL